MRVMMESFYTCWIGKQVDKPRGNGRSAKVTVIIKVCALFASAIRLRTSRNFVG